MNDVNPEAGQWSWSVELVRRDCRNNELPKFQYVTIRQNMRPLKNWHLASLVYRTTSKGKKHPMGCEAELPWKCLFTPIFWHILTRKLGQTGLVYGVRCDLLGGLCMQDDKSVCAAVTICATLVNTQIHTETHGHHFD